MSNFANVDELRIESDEGGFELHLWLDEDIEVPADGRIVLNIQRVAMTLQEEVERTIGPWAAEAHSVRVEWEASRGPLPPVNDEYPDHDLSDEGYDLDDPKHPTFRERMADWVDMARKREKGE